MIALVGHCYEAWELLAASIRPITAVIEWVATSVAPLWPLSLGAIREGESRHRADRRLPCRPGGGAAQERPADAGNESSRRSNATKAPAVSRSLDYPLNHVS